MFLTGTTYMFDLFLEPESAAIETGRPDKAEGVCEHVSLAASQLLFRQAASMLAD